MEAVDETVSAVRRSSRGPASGLNSGARDAGDSARRLGLRAGDDEAQVTSRRRAPPRREGQLQPMTALSWRALQEALLEPAGARLPFARGRLASGIMPQDHRGANVSVIVWASLSGSSGSRRGGVVQADHSMACHRAD
jgi:hypothetical protein